MSRYLVTGGFGFIGLALTQQLLRAGHRLIVVDDLRTSPFPMSVVTAEVVKWGEALQWIPKSLAAYAQMDDAQALDGIFHLASPVGPAGVLKSSGKIAQQILDDTELVAMKAAAHNCRLVFVSSSEVYGGGNKLLHNVVGGIGVLEGNGGPMRTGLPRQSVHDGESFRHEPLRLTVGVEAPVEAITAILAKHEGVRALFDQRWLHLIALGSDGQFDRRYIGNLAWEAEGPGAAKGTAKLAA